MCWAKQPGQSRHAVRIVPILTSTGALLCSWPTRARPSSAWASHGSSLCCTLGTSPSGCEPPYSP
eukprot:16442654-Heterocapsa_arctica.AAC.1